MGAIAVGEVLAVLAHAEVVLCLLGRKLDGRVRRSFVGSVAERLVFGQTAGAVVVLLADLQLDPNIIDGVLLGTLVSDIGSFHVFLLFLVLRILVLFAVSHLRS